MLLDPAVAATRVAVRRCLAELRPPALVLVACSGGADSLALAAAARWEAPRAGLRVGVVSVDHRLQAGSRERAEAVAGWASEADVAEVLSVTVERGGGPEAAARSARYAALDEAATRHDAAQLLLGHTLDDQAESVLLGLARGSGARSLAGMPARRGIYRRPFLCLRRADTEAACAALGLIPWQDPHNRNPALARARVRSTALPTLEATLGPGVTEALARTAGLLRDDADALDAWAAATGLDLGTLGSVPAAVRRRVLRSAALDAGVPGGRLTAEHLAAMDRLVVDWHGQGPVSLPLGHRAERRCGTLQIAGPDGRTGEI